MIEINNMSAEGLMERAKAIEVEVKPKAEQWSSAVQALLRQSLKEFEPARKEVEAIYERYSELRLLKLEELLADQGLYWDSVYNDLSPFREDAGVFFLSPKENAWNMEYTSPSRLRKNGKSQARDVYGSEGPMPRPRKKLPRFGRDDRLWYQVRHMIPKELERAFPEIGTKIKLMTSTSNVCLPSYQYHTIWNDSSYEHLREGKEYLPRMATA